MYALLKHAHLLIIAIAFLVFVTRGIFMMRNNTLAYHKIFNIIPHIFYTLLIATGIGLAIQQHLSPLEQPWLLAKLIALVVFVILGVLAFKHPSLLIRKVLWLFALVVFIYIASVAQSKNPLGFLSHLF
jgi:uncharacterized membrane protein SirB2